jgi:tetratricopeptide (TPR) repeat protein
VRRLSAWAAVVALAVGAAAHAADEPPAGAALPDPLELQLDELGPDVRSLLGTDRDAQLAMAALMVGRFVRARELAESMLANDPESVPGHCVLGSVLARAEGNLSGAAYHLRRCVDRYEEVYSRPREGDPWLWHDQGLRMLAQVESDLGRHDAALDVIDRIETHYRGNIPSRAWSLFELGRFDAATAAAQAALASSDEAAERVTAWTVLCAVASARRDREPDDETCLRALDEESRREIDPVGYTNAASVALAMLRPDAAEALLLDATEHFTDTTVAMPWVQLMHLYLAQGRFPEALDALRQSLAWRRRQLPWVASLTWSYSDAAAAHLLLVAGWPEEAAELADRAFQQPDRMGRDSGRPEELEAATALVARAAHLAAAEASAERASWSPWREALTAWFEAAVHRVQAWRAGRRVVANWAAPGLLEARLVPYNPTNVFIPPWIELDAVELLGAGVVEAAHAEAAGDSRTPGAAAFGLAFVAEAAQAAARDDQALDRAQLALERLPRTEALLRARIAAGAARAAAELSDAGESLSLLDLAWQIDPGVIRRRGLSLPVRIRVGADGVSREAASLVRWSPRFHVAPNGFELSIEAAAGGWLACLHGPQGALLHCAEASQTEAASDRERASLLVRRLHEGAFAPRVDLTQADLRSLDGSTVASGIGEAQVRLLMEDVLGTSDARAGDGGR